MSEGGVLKGTTTSDRGVPRGRLGGPASRAVPARAHLAAKALSHELYTPDALRPARQPALAFSWEAALYYGHSCSLIFRLEDVCAWET